MGVRLSPPAQMPKPQKEKPLVIVVVGPTAVGKSEYAINMALQTNGEIISADSRQVYTGLDVGSGKVTKKEMRGIPHHMLDVCSPKKVFSVHDFKKQAETILEDILARGKTPIIVGGTGFYVDTLLGKFSLPDVPANKILRKKLEGMKKETLFKKLKNLDPARAKTIDKDNPIRLIRAIEIAETLGKVPKIKKKVLPYKLVWMGLIAPRDVLRKKIATRTRSQLMQGMTEEVEKLHKNGITWKRLYELGLEQRLCALYLQGKMPGQNLEQKLVEKVYQYAMRQLRWFKRNKEINWIEIE